MNFKPTLWKGIISIVVGILGGSYLRSIYFDFIRNPSEIDIAIPFWTLILYIIVVMTLVYIIWSLIQKKKF